jgi:hypothetical protein
LLFSFAGGVIATPDFCARLSARHYRAMPFFAIREADSMNQRPPLRCTDWRALIFSI